VGYFSGRLQKGNFSKKMKSLLIQIGCLFLILVFFFRSNKQPVPVEPLEGVLYSLYTSSSGLVSAPINVSTAGVNIIANSTSTAVAGSTTATGRYGTLMPAADIVSNENARIADIFNASSPEAINRKDDTRMRINVCAMGTDIPTEFVAVKSTRSASKYVVVSEDYLNKLVAKKADMAVSEEKKKAAESKKVEKKKRALRRKKQKAAARRSGKNGKGAEKKSSNKKGGAKTVWDFNKLNYITKNSDRSYFLEYNEERAGNIKVKVYSVTPFEEGEIIKFIITNEANEYFFIRDVILEENKTIKGVRKIVPAKFYCNKMVSPAGELTGLAVIKNNKGKQLRLSVAELKKKNRLIRVVFEMP